MDDLVLLKPVLTKLRLSGILDVLDQIITQAVEEKWSYTQLLLRLCAAEVDRRNHKQICYKLSRSGLNPEKTLETFDFNFNKSITKNMIKELAECNFVGSAENIFFVGPSGVGKTHLANALGHEACRKGFDVCYERTGKLLDWIHAGCGDGSFRKRMDHVAKINLLILDDFGLLPVNDCYQEYLYEIISERYEKRATIITSNRDFSEWINIFANQLIGSAAMDRLVYKAIKITIEGDSYRTVNFKKKQKELFGEAKR